MQYIRNVGYNLGWRYSKYDTISFNLHYLFMLFILIDFIIIKKKIILIKKRYSYDIFFKIYIYNYGYDYNIIYIYIIIKNDKNNSNE